MTALIDFPESAINPGDLRIILYLDTDRNANTGLKPSIGGNQLNDLGADFWINLDNTSICVYQYGNPTPIGNVSGARDTYQLYGVNYIYIILESDLINDDDRKINYILVVSDFSEKNYDIFPNQGVFKTNNSSPVAEAGDDQSVVIIGSTVQLQGYAHDDDFGDVLTYQWTYISYPGTAAPPITDPNTLTPSFVVDDYGDYILELTVSDGPNSASDTMTVSFNNVAPVADAGTGDSVLLFDPVDLDGSGSSDANGDTLFYLWTWVSRPNGSTASIESATDPMASFVPDFPGTYKLKLVVNDGFLDSEPSFVTYEATATKDQAIMKMEDINLMVKDLDPQDFEIPNMQKALVNKGLEVINLIDHKAYKEANQKIEKDLKPKMDDFLPGKSAKDWITDLEAKKAIHDKLGKEQILLESISP